MSQEKPWIADADGFRSVLMFENTRVENIAAFAYSAGLARKLYTDFGNPPPPMPVTPLRYPCSMRVTEREKVGTGERIGRVQFVDLADDTMLFDQTWAIT